MNNYSDVNKNKRDKINEQIDEFKKKGGKIETIECGESADYKRYIYELDEQKKLRKSKKAH